MVQGTCHRSERLLPSDVCDALRFGNTVNAMKFKRQNITVEPKVEGVHVSVDTRVEFAMGGGEGEREEEEGERNI